MQRLHSVLRSLLKFNFIAVYSLNKTVVLIRQINLIWNFLFALISCLGNVYRKPKSEMYLGSYASVLDP